MASEKKIHHVKLATTLKLSLAALVLGLVGGAVGLHFYQTYNPPDVPVEAEIVAASVVFERVQEQDELVCASQKYNITEKAQNSNTIPFTNIAIPFTKNSYWYRYVGTIKAAVDLGGAGFEQKGETITISLDEPYISSNTPDMEQSQVLEENNNVFNPIHIDNFDAFRKKCMKQGESEAIEGGLLDEAKSNAEKNISDMFYAAMGDESEVKVVWREKEADQG